MTLGAIAPWWLLFFLLFLCVAVQPRSYDVSVDIVSEPAGSSQTADTPAP
jgi:hypothetical protein